VVSCRDREAAAKFLNPWDDDVGCGEATMTTTDATHVVPTESTGKLTLLPLIHFLGLRGDVDTS
jgi:hypothetical protein